MRLPARLFPKPKEAISGTTSFISALDKDSASGYSLNRRGTTFSMALRVVQFNKMQHTSIFHSSGQ